MGLREELERDPLNRGYATMSDKVVAVDLNTPYRSSNRTSMTASEMLNAMDDTELEALTDAKNTALFQLLSIGTLNPFGREETMIRKIFGAGSVSVAALAIARVEPITRAQELRLRGRIGAGRVAEARRRR